MLVTGLPSILAGMVNVPDAFLSHLDMVTALSFTSYFKLGLTGVSSFVGSFGEDFAVRNS